ncbi:MAG: M14-type cytosolic carboxypeptidase [Pseudomonadota bacterium]
MTLSINAAFDSGNIVCLSAEDPGNIRLEIRRDNESDFYQWFHFRLSGARDIACRMVIENAEGAAYPKGWPDYDVCASYDRQTWFRVPTAYENGRLIIQHTPELDSVYFAYFAPYSMDRHADMVADAAQSDLVELRILGETLDGRAMDCLSIVGEGEDRRTIWIIARQHPGETMAEWAAEGLVTRLLDLSDPVGRALRARADVHIVPNMNPDGSFRGHLRTNAAGSNLNREWAEPSPEKSPEVLCVLSAMRQTGCDLFLDMHGDEAIPYNFIAGAEGAPGFSDKDDGLLQAYKAALITASPDFQTKYGYPRNAPGTANMSIAGNAVFGYFGCLSMTLEMPFKDNADLPDEDFGWSPDRCRYLGAANLDAMLAVIDQVR